MADKVINRLRNNLLFQKFVRVISGNLISKVLGLIRELILSAFWVQVNILMH